MGRINTKACAPRGIHTGMYTGRRNQIGRDPRALHVRPRRLAVGGGCQAAYRAAGAARVLGAGALVESRNRVRSRKRAVKLFGWVFFLFSFGSPRTPHGAYVRRARQNRIDRHGGEIERLALQAIDDAHRAGLYNSGKISSGFRSFRFRLAPRACAPCGPSARVVSRTTSRKIPTRQILPFVFACQLKHGETQKGV